MTKISLVNLQALIAPLAVPVPQSMLLGNEVYQVLVLARVPVWMSIVAGICAGIGLEAAGGATLYAAVRLARRREWGSFLLALAGVLVYVAVVAGAMLVLPEARARVFVVFAFLTPFAYASYALVQSVKEEDSTLSQKMDYKLAALNQERLIKNAEIRLAKAQSRDVPTVPGTGGTGSEPGTVDTPQKVAVFQTLEQTPDMGVNELARQLGIGKATASRHRQAWLNQR